MREAGASPMAPRERLTMTIRFEQQQAVTACDVLREDVLERRRLSVTGLAVDCDVAQALFERQPVR
jgi:hypothetical protein